MSTKDEEQAKRDTLVGRFDRAMYGDLLNKFGPPATNDDDEFDAQVTGSTPSDLRAAQHDARNDAEIRESKPNSND
ncbi:MAG: hypothetical protein HY044_05090 [Candidatus Woesebacteria bacterium]|nr:MAG: hypothetical protein HY044_05090 [Candidatus Woesebacteria bacterium]